MNVYLGCPIDNAEPGKAALAIEKLYSLVAAALTPECVCFNPLSAFIGGKSLSTPHGAEFLININDFALRMADLAVFMWNGSASYGVPVEIEKCAADHDYKKAVFVLNASGQPAGVYMRFAVGQSGGIISDNEKDLEGAIRRWSEARYKTDDAKA